MNVAFLLITTGWAAGADGAPPAAPPTTTPPAAIAPSLSPAPMGATDGAHIPGPIGAPIGSGSGCGCGYGGCGGDCGGDCGVVSDCGCGGGHGGGFFSRFRGRFGKHHGGACGCAPAYDCGCAPAYDCGCGSADCGCCGAVTSCGCDGGHGGGGFFSRLRGRFGRHGGGDCGCAPACDTDCGCDSGGCGSAGAMYGGAPLGGYPSSGAHYGSSYPGVIAPGGTVPPATAPAGEPIKKMPEGVEDKGKGGKGDGKGGEGGQTQESPPSRSSTPGPGARAPLGDSSDQGAVAPAAAKKQEETKNPFELDRRYEKRVGRAADYSRLTGQLFYVHADGGLWVLRYAPLWKEEANGGSVVLARDRQLDNYRDGDLVNVEGSIVQERGSSRLGGPLYRIRSIQLLDRPQ